MTPRIAYLILMLNSFVPLLAQSIDFKLAKAGCAEFKNFIICYGLSTNNLNTEIKFYKITKDFSITDSLIIKVNDRKSENYLSLFHDTLHGYFNVYVQQIGEKRTEIYRLNKQFKVIAIIKDVEVTRLNNKDIFEQKPYYYNEFVYSIKSENDTSGKQFYLNKFSLKDSLKNFEYKQTWQFPFEKKDIRYAEVIYANLNFVFVHASLFKGNKKGEWLLKLDAKNGKIIKGTKLNKNNESFTYIPGYFTFDYNKKSFSLVGEKLREDELNFNKLQFKPNTLSSFYLLQIDSLGEILNRFDLKTTIVSTTPSKKETEIYLTRLSKITALTESYVECELDVYKKKFANCYVYAQSARRKFELNSELASISTHTISPNILIETNYITRDKFDINGQVCTEQVENIENLYRKAPLLDVKQGFAEQKDKNPKWLLKKSHPKSGLISYSILKPGLKSYELNLVNEYSKDQNSGLIVLNTENFAIFSQTSETNFSIKLSKW